MLNNVHTAIMPSGARIAATMEGSHDGHRRSTSGTPAWVV
jgi:hypothetical protein